jgi:uncharacterized membrane protein
MYKNIIVPLLLSLLYSINASACDPKENCNRCLVSIFGHCKVRGNDPVCEARKAACPVPVIGPGVTAPGMPMGPGGVLGPGGPGIGPITGEDLKKCIANPSSCPKIVLTSAVYGQLAPVLDQYTSFLEQQGNGRWKSVPNEIASSVRTLYPEINFADIRFAEGINTLHGQAITIGSHIFFPQSLDLDDKDDLRLLFHELEHVGQYIRRGGVRPFLAEYVAKIPGQVIARRSFNVHDALDIERAAISKSDIVLRSYWGREFYVQNSCAHPIQVALAYLPTEGDWKATGYWQVNPSERFYLSDEDGARLRSHNGTSYWYAEATDESGVLYTGDRRITVDTDSRTLNFLEKHANNPDHFTVNFTCSNN